MTAPAKAPPAVEVEPWPGARTGAATAWRSGLVWMARAACAQPGVDPAWFVVEEDAPGAAELIAHAKAVCGLCPVRLWCRIHADATGEYGVYAGETYTERIRRLRRWHAMAEGVA
jgi:WhiB family transcriptional regulator, redox-sensing transcriptional regulator